MKAKNKVQYLAIAMIMAICGCDDFKFAQYEVTEKPFVDRTSVDLFLNTDPDRAFVQLHVSPADSRFTWESQNTDVATVDQSGLITAVAEGQSTIVVRSENDQFDVRVRVQEWVPAERITLEVTSVQRFWYGKPDRFRINALVEPTNSTETDLIEWSTSDPEIATVTHGGWVTYTNIGRVVITASAKGTSAPVVLEVLEMPTFRRTDPEFIDRANWSFPGFQDGSQSGQYGYSSQATNEGDSPRGRVIAMIDGNNQTFWHARWASPQSDYPHWFIIDLGEVTTIGGVMIRTRHDNSGSATGFQLFTSDMEIENLAGLSEATIWTNAGRFTHTAAQNTEHNFALLPPFPKARYVRVFFGPEYRGTGQYTMIAEFGLYRPRLLEEPEPEP